MKETVYNFTVNLDWNLLGIISKIDRFDASWSSIEKNERQSLKQLKSIATIQSVGASTRIEGSQLNDKDVEKLLNDIDISKIIDRDSQEVVGYFNVLDLISDGFNNIDITANNIKNLHNQLLKYSEKDNWHRGDYKQHTNAVEAKFPDGSTQIIFRTTEPGFATDDAMRNLIFWYEREKIVHPLISVAAFVYDFLSIHPFQDGNGRLSRLLTTLLLLKRGYNWIQYVSLEHEIENRKKDYYKNLRICQTQRPNEDITEWIVFFFEALINVQNKLSIKLEQYGLTSELSPRDKAVYNFISDHAGCKIGQIIRNFDVSSSTMKRIVNGLIEKGLVRKYGTGSGTNYSVK